MGRSRYWRTIAALVVLAASPLLAQQNYPVGNFDVYAYSLNGDLIPDVDKNFHNDTGSNSCWQASAANLLAAAGYGKGAGQGATAQQRADHIYGQLTGDLGTANLGCADKAINYWLYTYGKNPASPEYMPDNPYTDVTAVSNPIPLVPYVQPPQVNAGYNWLLDELVRDQFVAVMFDDPRHCMTLVGGNYWNNPNGRPDGNKSIWHDSDGAATAPPPPPPPPPGGGDHPDTVTHPLPIGQKSHDDVYTNAPGVNNWWTLSDYWSGPTTHADAYVTLCPGLNKPQDAVENYDVAYYLQALDADQKLDDRAFRVAGAMGAAFGQPQWQDDFTLFVENEHLPQLHKEVYLLVDYNNRVAGRQENIQLLSDDGRLWNPVVTPSADDGQLLFTWGLDYQPAWEHIIFPDDKYRLLDGDVKDWDLATLCVPEPATLALVGLGVAALVARRRAGRHGA